MSHAIVVLLSCLGVSAPAQAQPLAFEVHVSQVHAEIATVRTAQAEAGSLVLAADIQAATTRTDVLVDETLSLLKRSELMRCQALTPMKPARYGRCSRGPMFTADVRQFARDLRSYAMSVQDLGAQLAWLAPRANSGQDAAEPAARLSSATRRLTSISLELLADAGRTSQAVTTAGGLSLLDGRDMQAAARDAYNAARDAGEAAGSFLRRASFAPAP